MTAPFTPGGYIKARRCAGGLSIEDVAAKLPTVPRDAEHDRIAWLKLIEADVQPMRPSTVDALETLIDFDREVLGALDAIAIGAMDPAFAPQVCRICACSELDPCWTESGEPCAWEEPDLCTDCHHPGPATPTAAAVAA
jgi:hypothetical protein